MSRIDFDRQCHLVFVLSKNPATGLAEWRDRTDSITALYQEDDGRIRVYFSGQSDTGKRSNFSYSPSKVLILEPQYTEQLSSSSRVMVNGDIWSTARFVQFYDGALWARVWYQTRSGGLSSRTYPGRNVRVISESIQPQLVNDVMGYARAIVAQLDQEDPLRRAFERIGPVHPDSALARILEGDLGDPLDYDVPRIFPFSSNLSQREAIENALHHRISVIEGPPGTGKTQTILNLVANLVQQVDTTVGVVSYGNAATDNIYDKLTRLGFGFIAAPLGSRKRVEAFIEGQSVRNDAVEVFAAVPAEEGYAAEDFDALSRRVHRVHTLEREAALARTRRDSLAREYALFSGRYPSHSVLPTKIARLNAHDSLQLLAELTVQHERMGRFARARWSFRARRKYGVSTRALSNWADLATPLQHQAYRRMVEEVDLQLAVIARELKDPLMWEASQNLGETSLTLLTESLRRQYQGYKPHQYSEADLRTRRSAFFKDYPVVLSTCHSLPRTVGEGRLLDYVIIDEASQVDLLTAILALNSARNAVIVGDLAQLPHIPVTENQDGRALSFPDLPEHLRHFDYQDHSILATVLAAFGTGMPRTMLREHYRCHPDIIEFCNRRYYNGNLIPMRSSDGGADALQLIETAPGSHARHFSDGGWINEREIDTLLADVLPDSQKQHGAPGIAFISPYRKQAQCFSDKIAGLGAAPVEADTVHKFQGREKKAVLFSPVIDSRHSEGHAVEFVDDARMINVAVSRAQEQFVLVANPELPPTATNLHDLVGFIKRREGASRVSGVVSVFDLLYDSYSPILQEVARRMVRHSRYVSEDLGLSLINLVISESPDLACRIRVICQVYTRDLVPSLAELSHAEIQLVNHGSSVDFVVENHLTGKVLGVIEVDGFRFHADSAAQRQRDALKDSILRKSGIPVLRLPTTGSGEAERLRVFLRAAASA